MKRWLGVFLWSWLLGACAVPPLALNFQPRGPLPEDWHRFLGQKVALLEVEDARPGSPGILLYSGPEGRVELMRDPLAALTEAFEKQLRHAGFYVERAKSKGQAQGLKAYRIFKISLEKLEVTPKDSWFERWVAKLGYRVDLFDGKGEPLAYGASFYGEQELLGLRQHATLQEALDTVVEKAVKELLTSQGLQKYL